MSIDQPTKIGEVSEVSGSTVSAILDPNLAGIAPIYEGQLREVGQIGSFVRIPQGLVDLIGTVSGISYSDRKSELEKPDSGSVRPKLEAELIGQLDRGTENFDRGVASYPSIGDEIHFTTYEDLNVVFPSAGKENIEIGHLSSDVRIPVSVDLKKLVTRHSAVVGQTGSGKTNTIATILQNLVDNGYSNSNIIVIDPHGEYEAALEDLAKVQSVLPDGDEQIKVPYWAFPFESILNIFADGYVHGPFKQRFDELVTKKRREFVDDADWLDIEPSAVTRETPVPFNIHEVWYELDFENNETVHPDGYSVIWEEGDPEELRRTKFERYGPAGEPPNQGDNYNAYGAGPERLRYGLQDPQLSFLKEPKGEPDGGDPLAEVVPSWLGNEHPISVLDFKGVPDRVTQSAIGVIMDLIFELSLRSDADSTSGEGIGRASPVLIVLEEAHRYLGGSDGMSQIAANRIAREGRKYGVGLLAVTQRPSEIPETVFSQLGTIISLRLTNPGDQNRIKSALPDVTRGLADALPSLRTHEAIISGEALEIPARMTLEKPSPYPDSEDPSLNEWENDPEIPSVEGTLRKWRELFN